MVNCGPNPLLHFIIDNLTDYKVASSIIAAWADISDAVAIGDPAVAEAAYGLASVTGVVSKMNIGYFWMFLNCATSAAYVGSLFPSAAPPR